MHFQTWAYVGSAIGLAGALTNTARPDAITISEQSKNLASYPTSSVSKLITHDRGEFSSGATQRSAISSGIILADGTVVEEKESIVGSLLEKAIDDIDKQIEENEALKAQKQARMNEEAKLKAETEARQKVVIQQQKVEAEARTRAEEQKMKEQVEAKVSLRLQQVYILLWRN